MNRVLKFLDDNRWPFLILPLIAMIFAPMVGPVLATPPGRQQDHAVGPPFFGTIPNEDTLYFETETAKPTSMLPPQYKCDYNSTELVMFWDHSKKLPCGYVSTIKVDMSGTPILQTKAQLDNLRRMADETYPVGQMRDDIRYRETYYKTVATKLRASLKKEMVIICGPNGEKAKGDKETLGHCMNVLNMPDEPPAPPSRWK